MTLLAIKVTGIKEFQAVLKRSPEIAGTELATAINVTAGQMWKFATQYAPADTQDLRRSIQLKKASEKDLTALVGTSLFYAPYQEFGTGIYVGKGYIYPKRGKFLRFKTKSGQVIYARRVKGVPPVKYMQRARADGQRAWGVNSEKALNTIVRILATE